MRGGEGGGAEAAIPASTGGRFAFEPDALESHLARWEGLQSELERDRQYAEELLGMRAPGDEPASRTMANLVRRSGEVFLEHNDALRVFVDGHVQAMRAARDTYVAGDESAAHLFGRRA